MSFATDQVALLKSAYTRVLEGQSVRLGERVLTLADASWISSELDKWLRKASNEAVAAAGGTPGVVIADFSGRSGGCEGQGWIE
ncbi:hypothetical protein SAMN06296058_1259 [Pseudoxanthomonas indica]|uniref:Uncharacterized protein n=1 Tax=Pseudoxanthomonas indica TaxID=428993 RepID=A0A1T5K0U6_9GAMM|nr:hypothetical protein GCM10007235_17180 [Pseudoxanthomonas indica]SKC57271.1 hypothetical protein SAMN06296058_1259 [Pseudoxanthomonas indica]